MTAWTRRRALRALLAGTGPALLWPGATAFPQSGSSLSRVKRQALVIGNGKYKDHPLRNPANDARDIAAALTATGFETKVALDLTQAGMREAIGVYAKELARTKAVGLFYFAGHGVQLAWRNYLIPVEADIHQIEELRDRAVDVNSVVEGMRKAGNPMNLIILDACRDNPFGRARVEQRGLSQLDAPLGTLLAYATAPGHTAIDGEGSNGLYTEHLLKEIKVPGTKVEDVFKRVRLGVRRRSNGVQIPWESTSLEEDFWFLPPAQTRSLSDGESEREFNQELVLWESIQGAADPAPFEDYLRRFPSGVFSEVAQLKLDGLLARQGEKKIELVEAAENPFSKGTARVNTRFRAGDRFEYRQTDITTKAEVRTATQRVTEVTDSEVIFNGGRTVTDLLGNTRKQADGDLISQSQVYIPEYSVGKKWKSRYKIVKLSGKTFYGEWEFKVVGREPITVPAGTFNAFHVVGYGFGEEARSRLSQEYWITPEIGRYIAREYKRTDKAGRATRNERSELISYRQGR